MRFTNAVQELREGTRLGIPALFKDNSRNPVEVSPTCGIGQDAGAFIEFPKEAGLAAAALGAAAPPRGDDGTPLAGLRGDMRVIRDCTRGTGQLPASRAAVGRQHPVGGRMGSGPVPQLLQLC